MRRTHFFGLLLLVALVVTPPAFSAPSEPRQNGTQDDDVQQIETLEVFLPITVLDKEKRHVPGLTRSNFRVYENGKEQEITSFDAPTQLPLQIGLLMDTSGSVKRKLEFEREAAVGFVSSILERSVDYALFATFDSVVTLHVDFTRDSGDVIRAIDRVKASGNTRLYDAIYRICEEKMVYLPADTRPVIVVITDGADVGSDRTLDEAIRIAQQANVTIYGISTRNFSDINAGTVRGSIDKDLLKLCEKTGGLAFLPYQKVELHKAFANIRENLRKQYVIYYRPDNQNRDGKFREVEVKVTGVDGRVKVHAKEGYYAIPREEVSTGN